MRKEGVFLCGAAFLGGPSGVSAAAPKGDARPNILLCVADDASWLHFGAYGCEWVSTPVFDSIARNGVLFENCYTPNAKSAPSRAMLLTGLYSWQLGEAGNHICRFPGDIRVFTEALADAGYDVAFTGKGWAPGDAGEVGGRPRRLTGSPYQSCKLTPPTPEILSTDYAANFSAFLASRGECSRPWCFWFGCREPHRRYEYGSGVAKGGRSTAEIDRVPGFWPDNEEVRNDLLDYGFEIEHYDRQLGALLSHLSELGELDNTLVIVTSDNGMPFPRAKGTQYEYGHHVPLAVMWVRGVRHPGRRERGYVSFTDIAPTILEAAGVDPEASGMRRPSGRSLLPLLKDEADPAAPFRERALLGRERHDNGRPGDQGYPIRGIVRGGWLYLCNLKPWLLPGGNPETGYRDIDSSPTKTSILQLKRNGLDSRYYGLSMGLRPSEELYHVSGDRDCLHNLIDAPELRALADSLREELFGALREQGDPRVTGDGDIFDRYPYDKSDRARVYERTLSGEIIPWEADTWILPGDYEQYGKANKESTTTDKTE